jgi:hypothetical protein
MPKSMIASLVDGTTIIFRGTVRALSASTMREVWANDSVAIVRVDKVLYAMPDLGDLTGTELTLRWSGASKVAVGEQAIFFTNPWIYGTRIAVSELGRAELSEERDVLSEIENKPSRQLAARLDDTELLIAGKVEKVEPSGVEEPISHHSPGWMRAKLQVESVEKGKLAAKQVDVLFPSASDVKWRWAPRLQVGQEGVFLLQRGQGPYAPSDAYTIIDPRDVHPRKALSQIKKLLK